MGRLGPGSAGGNHDGEEPDDDGGGEGGWTAFAWSTIIHERQFWQVFYQDGENGGTLRCLQRWHLKHIWTYYWLCTVLQKYIRYIPCSLVTREDVLTDSHFTHTRPNCSKCSVIYACAPTFTATGVCMWLVTFPGSTWRSGGLYTPRAI